MSGTSANLDSDGLSVSPSRIFLSKDDINSMDKQQLLASWHKQEAYINWLESQLLASQLGTHIGHMCFSDTSKHVHFRL